MQAILDSGWQFLSISGFISHLLVLLLAISFMGGSLLRKKKLTTLQLLERFVIPHTNLQLRLLIAAFVISYSSLTYLPYPHTPLWVLLLLTWIIFPLGMSYGWFAWLGLLKEEDVKKGRVFKDPEFPGLFVGLVAVICFFVFKPSLGESEFFREKKAITNSLYSFLPETGSVTIQAYEASLLPSIVSRWGMLFYHPEGWNRREPDNGDGYRFTFPENAEVYVIGSGSYTTSTGCESFCPEELAQERSFIAQDKDSEFLSEGSIERWVIADSSQINAPYNQILEGYQFSYSYTGDSGEKMFVMKSFTVHDGINFSVYTHCPFDLRARFESLFLELGERFFILNDEYETDGR